MARIIAAVRKFAVAEQGATTVEYGLLVAVIVVACCTVLFELGSRGRTRIEAVAAAADRFSDIGS